MRRTRGKPRPKERMPVTTARRSHSFLRMYELTGDAEDRTFAREAAREAVEKLHHQGLRGHPAKPYYESLDGVGDLLCALLDLDSSARR